MEPSNGGFMGTPTNTNKPPMGLSPSQLVKSPLDDDVSLEEGANPKRSMVLQNVETHALREDEAPPNWTVSRGLLLKNYL